MQSLNDFTKKVVQLYRSRLSYSYIHAKLATITFFFRQAVYTSCTDLVRQRRQPPQLHSFTEILNSSHAPANSWTSMGCTCCKSGRISNRTDATAKQKSPRQAWPATSTTTGTVTGPDPVNGSTSNENLNPDHTSQEGRNGTVDALQTSTMATQMLTTPERTPADHHELEISNAPKKGWKAGNKSDYSTCNDSGSAMINNKDISDQRNQPNQQASHLEISVPVLVPKPSPADLVGSYSKAKKNWQPQSQGNTQTWYMHCNNRKSDRNCSRIF